MSPSKPATPTADIHEKENAGVEKCTSSEEEIIELTDEDNRRILWKIDLNLLSLIAWIYWLQILDKTVLGNAATYGLQTDANLHGNQYSSLGSMNAIGQLAGLDAFLKLSNCSRPPRLLLSVIVTCWGIALCGMAASTNYASLAACRFLLGVFEAGCLPIFAVLTSVWYRRAEQPLRVAIWYGTNGLGTIMASALSYAFGRINHPKLHPYQIIFLFCGLLTVISGPFIYWRVPDHIGEARFLSPQDRKKAVERIRVNNTGTRTNDAFKWRQALEGLLEPKSWLFVAMTLFVNVGAAVANTFGPLILNGIGFDKFKTSLLNMPFGGMQLLVIFLSSYLAYACKIKSAILAFLALPVLAGLVILYALPRPNEPGLLVGYYLIACLYGANPLIVAWISANTGGSTKKSVVLGAYNAASSIGNIIGPLLFKASDAPLYSPGVRACIGLFSALTAGIGLQVLIIMFLNRNKRRQRVQNGKPVIFHDRSMDKHFKVEPYPATSNELRDLTDHENDEFVYVY
ncbi:major facilitator superfamily domain-containing protein [Mycena galopus ATCC 62051]|nr:major facilitator superfamily domain-containing protein [Mycena galopus ATCC 62051]